VEYVLLGFRQFDLVRQYDFDAIGKDRARKRISVGVDLELIRRYKIPMQELPLLCKRLLVTRAKAESIAFTESDMDQYAQNRTAALDAQMEKRRARRPPVSSRAGEAWRVSPLPLGHK